MKFSGIGSLLMKGKESKTHKKMVMLSPTIEHKALFGGFFVEVFCNGYSESATFLQI